MQDHWGSMALPRITTDRFLSARLQRQVSTYLLYRSFSTDERNRRGLHWWRDALHRHAEGSP